MNPLDPTTTARLLALPSLREQAEREYASRVQTQVQDLAMQRAARLRGTEVEARLLADITRWQSQAWALREIGRLLGWDCGDGVPNFSKLVSGKSPELRWALSRKPKHIGDQTSAYFYDGWPYYVGPIRDAWDHWPPQQCKHKTWKAHKVPGLSKHNEYPAAIAAILLHLSEGKS